MTDRDDRIDPAPAGGRPGGDPRAAIPGTVRIAGWISTLQGLAGAGTALFLSLRALLGHREESVVISGYGTALWFLLIGGAVLAAGIGLLRGRRWGRGIVVLAELLLLPVAWYLATGSGQVLAGAVLAVVSVVALVALFRRESVEWYTA